MKDVFKRLAVCVVFAALPLLSGCVGIWLAGGLAAAGGGGYYMFSRGTYVAMLDSSLFDSDAALRRVAKRAQFIQLNRKCDGYGCSYLYQDLNGVKVRFRLKGVAPDATELYIRIGKFGDKTSSQALLKAIDEELQLGRH